MRPRFCSVLVLMLLLATVCVCGCAPNQTSPPLEGIETTCIQGTVLYKSPVDGKEVPYAGATVGVWLHDTEQGLTETKTDARGNFCLQVPLGDFKVDVRVWGMTRLEHKTYICKGSADNIDLGSIPMDCGSRECLDVLISAECNEYIPIRRRS